MRLIIIFCFIPWICKGQELNDKLIDNYFSYKMGAAIPFYSVQNDLYQFTKKDLGFGLSGGIAVGHYFNRSINLSTNADIIYSNYGKGNYEYELYSDNGEILYEYLNGEISYSHLSISVGLNLESNISKKISIGFGGYFMRQILAYESHSQNGAAYYYYSYAKRIYIPYGIPKVLSLDDSKNSGPSMADYIGLKASFNYIISSNRKMEKSIGVEYITSLIEDSIFNKKEHWVVVKFSKKISI